MVNKNVLSCLLKDGKEVNAVMLVGRLFHARVTVTRNDVYLYVSVGVCVSVCCSACVCVCVCTSVYVLVCLSVYMPVCVCVCVLKCIERDVS